MKYDNKQQTGGYGGCVVWIIGLVFLFSSFKNENENKWTCHTILERPFHKTCLVVIIDAKSRDEAELKFDIFIEEKEKELMMKQYDKTAYAVEPIKKSIIAEHKLKPF